MGLPISLVPVPLPPRAPGVSGMGLPWYKPAAEPWGAAVKGAAAGTWAGASRGSSPPKAAVVHPEEGFPSSERQNHARVTPEAASGVGRSRDAERGGFSVQNPGEVSRPSMNGEGLRPGLAPAALPQAAPGGLPEAREVKPQLKRLNSLEEGFKANRRWDILRKWVESNAAAIHEEAVRLPPGHSGLITAGASSGGTRPRQLKYGSRMADLVRSKSFALRLQEWSAPVVEAIEGFTGNPVV